MSSVAPSPTVVSPLKRIARTAAQISAGLIAAQPIITSGFGLPEATVAKASGLVAGLIFVLSALQNVLEHFGIMPTAGAKK